MKVHHSISTTLGLALLLAATSARAFPIVIDDFQGGPHVARLTIPIGDPVPQTNSATFLYAGAVGGERDCIVIGTKPGIYGAGVAFGVGGFESFVGCGEGAIIWDGIDGDALTDAQGLGGLDLKSGCVNPILQVTAFADHPEAVLRIFAFTSPTDYLLYAIPLMSGVTEDYSVPLDMPTSTVGAPDLSNINTLAMYIDGIGFDNLDILVYRLQVNCPGEPRTKGFWGNKNGKEKIAEMIAGGVDVWGELNALNLRNAAGALVTFTTHDQLKAWLQGANANNMAYMLSAQLAAMKLNVLAGFVSTSAALSGPGFPDPLVTESITVGDLITAAVAALAADGNTPAGDPNRAYQEYLKNVLDAGNNGGGGFGGYDYL